VWVHATLVKRGQAVAHCTLEEIQASRVLEVPLWMLDAAVCCKAGAPKPGFASAQSLRELKEVLQAARPRLSFAKNASVPKTVIFYWFWRLGSGIQRLNLWHVTLLRASSAELDAPLNPIWVYSLKR
jgi:hypothetical protein